MKAVVQNLKTGRLQVDDVPPPSLQPEGILVRVRRSLISLGTEKAVIALANKGPIGKAQDRPDLAQKVLNKAKQEGFWNTYKVVSNLISAPIPLGYSCAGEVIEVGDQVSEFRVGDPVACAGLNFANHAEVNYIPRNLSVKIPESLTYDAASFVTIGAIAMQGVRLAEIELGEKVVVMGLGLIGQVAAQLARCAGGTVLATDLDPTKTELAFMMGSHHAISDPKSLQNIILSLTDGHGADAVILCASTKSHELIQTAAEISRLKGRVIVVGDVGMHVERRAYFEKELKLIVSRSYGPGRYDPTYEVRGVDYPFPFVRWTEGRNMQSFVELMARGDVRVDPLITHRYAIEQAEEAYEIVTGKKNEPAIAILLEYEGLSSVSTRVDLDTKKNDSKMYPVRLGVIGAGQFAQGVLLPEFAKQKALEFAAFCTSSGLKSRHVAERYRANFCTSDPHEIIQNPAINTVLITTRHNQHALLTLEALKAGKAVFVEKPLALSSESLAEICNGVKALSGIPLMVGYNRRFSPLTVECKEFFTGCADPLFILYRVNAGTFPPETWVFDPVEGGGRIIGEVCHFVDMLCYLTGSYPSRIFAEEVDSSPHPAHNRDSVIVNLRMSNGSVGVIHYMANGASCVSKEYMEVYGGQRTAILNNYKSLSLCHGSKRRTKRLFNQAKGHAEEVSEFVRAIETGDQMPISFETLVAVTQTTFLIHRSLDLGVPVDYVSPLVERVPS